MALVFLTVADFESKLGISTLAQLTGNDDTKLQPHENTAIAYITDMLGEIYDLQHELALTANERNATLVRYMLNLAAYFLYDHIPDDEIPERITKNYDDTTNELEKIASGKRQVDLKHLTDETGNKLTTFRAGSNTPRNHNPF